MESVQQIEGVISLGTALPLWSVFPFVGLLLSIAVFPLVAPSFWHHYFTKISAFWALIFAIPFLIMHGGEAWYEILHIYLADYFPFIILLWGLFTVSGGIYIRGKLKGTPAMNTLVLAIGTVIASWVGTTGAAMLLIRPLIRSNRERRSMLHVVVFFIFLVANIGGSLTPLGDPPLFLGFLQGVAFFWTLNLLPMMSMLSIILLGLFFVIDTWIYRREQPGSKSESGTVTAERKIQRESIRIEGWYNLILLAGIMGSVLMSGIVELGELTVGGVHLTIQGISRDLLIVVIGLLSLWLTPTKVRQDNEFTWFPIKEVACLFAGIFMTIIPALAILRAGEQGELAFLIRSITEPGHYFWVTGLLSSCLDNAPTYLTFLSSAIGQLVPDLPTREAIQALMTTHILYLEAISCGAVFMGALTYIGNAPNFMVKSIAEEAGIAMPSFFGFMVWSVGILLPLFLLVNYVFFI